MQTDEQKAVLKLYGAMAASVALQCLPAPILQAGGMALMLGALTFAYGLRRKSSPDTLAHNHMTFLIRTVWVSALFLLAGFAGASVWFYQVGDHGPIHAAVDKVLSGLILDESSLFSLLEEYKDLNFRALVLASVFAAAPPVLYFGLRIAKGFSRAARSYRIANPNQWF